MISIYKRKILSASGRLRNAPPDRLLHNHQPDPSENLQFLFQQISFSLDPSYQTKALRPVLKILRILKLISKPIPAAGRPLRASNLAAHVPSGQDEALNNLKIVFNFNLFLASLMRFIEI